VAHLLAEIYTICSVITGCDASGSVEHWESSHLRGHAAASKPSYQVSICL